MIAALMSSGAGSERDVSTAFRKASNVYRALRLHLYLVASSLSACYVFSLSAAFAGTASLAKSSTKISLSFAFNSQSSATLVKV